MLRSMHAIRSKFQSTVLEFEAGPQWSRGSGIAVWAIGAGAIVAAVVAVPTREEVAYGLIGDKNFKAARGRLVDIHAQGRGSLHSAIALHEVHLKFGELDQAEKVIQTALEAHPGTVELLKRAARFYLHVQEPAKRLRMLVRLLNIEPTSGLLDEALQLLRLHGNYQGEKAILLGFAKSQFLSAAHHERLGLIFAREQKFGLAANHLIRADTMSTTPNRRLRMALFRLLLLQQRVAKSQALVKQWLSDKVDRDQIAFFYNESIYADRTQLAEGILDDAVSHGLISRAEVVQMRRGLEE